MQKKMCVLVVVATGVFFAGAANAMAGEIRVDDDGAQCAKAAFTTIQAAVDAAQPGDKVTVCPGTYAEQVTIGAGKDGVKVVGQKPLQAVVKAPAAMAAGSGHIVNVNAAQDVQIKDLTISGPFPASSCAEFARTGVRVDGGGSATIEKNHITEIRAADPALRGCQYGVGIQVGRSVEGQVGTATIKGNVIDSYQKNGMTIDGAGSSARVANNEIGPAGASEINAPNGIQVSRGAVAEVRHNEVSGNVYTPGTTSGTGILLYQAGAVTVENNKVFGNDVGIYLWSTNGAKVKSNNSHDNTFDGFFVESDATGNVFENNKASGNAEHDCHDDSVGTGTGGTGNTWKNNKGETANVAGICNPGDVTP
jgi:parallel beta-helix repeat protein